MVVKVYYSEISGSKEVKKRQQRVMMILDSKTIPYEPIDITEPGNEAAKDFMLTNAKPKGDSKIILSPQIFNDERYCGDYDDFDLANENDNLEQLLGTPKVEKSPPPVQQPIANGKSQSREPSAEVEPPVNGNVVNQEPAAEVIEETAAVDVEESVPEEADEEEELEQ